MSVLNKLTNEEIKAILANQDDKIDYSRFTNEEIKELLALKEENDGIQITPESPDKGSALIEGIKAAGAFGAGAVSGATYGLPKSPYMNETVSSITKSIEEKYPASFGTGELAGEVFSPVGKLAKAGKILQTAGLAATEQGIKGILAAKDTNEIAKESASAGMFGAGIGAGVKAAGGAYGLGKKFFMGTGDEMSKVYDISRKEKALLHTPEFGKKIADDFFANLSDFEKTIATKKADVGKELEQKLAESRYVDKVIDESGKVLDIQNEFRDLINTYITKIKNERSSLIAELSKDKVKAADFLEGIRNSAIFKDPNRAGAYHKELTENLGAYSDLLSEVKEDTLTEAGQKLLRDRGFNKQGAARINKIPDDALRKGESKVQVMAEINDIKKMYDETLNYLNDTYLKKNRLSVTDLVDFKRDMYDFLNYDKISLPNVGVDISLDSTKKFKFRPVEDVLQSLTRDVKTMANRFDDLAGVSGERGLSDIDDEYHALKKLEEYMPKVNELKYTGDKSAISNAALKTRAWRELLSKQYPKEAQNFLTKNDELIATKGIFDKIVDDNYMGFLGVNKVAGRVSGYPFALKSASVAGETVGKFEQRYPMTSKIAGGVADLASRSLGFKPSAVMAERLGEKYPEAAGDTTSWLMGGEAQAQEIPMAPNIPPVSQMPPPLLAPELAQGLRMERSYTAAVRNKDILLPNLYSIDPAAGKTFENALASQDTKAVENMMSMFTQMPEYENIFQPSPVKTSKGDAKSAVVVPGNKARIVNPMEVSTMTSDIKYNDALSEKDKMLQIDQLHRSSTINLN